MNDIRPFVIPGSRCARPGMTVVDDVGIIPCHDEKRKK
jgi:hypothetical protein